MIAYHQGQFGLLFAFRLKGSVFHKSFPWGLFAAAIASTLHKVFKEYPEIRDTLRAGDIGASVLSGFIFILGFLIVFRSQQAYSRWWEGGSLLQQVRGEWFNAFSSLLAFCNTDKEKSEEVRMFQHRLVRLVSLLYAAALEQVTTIHKPHLEVIQLEGFDLHQFAFMQNSHDKCETVLQWLQRLIVEADAADVLKIQPPILGRVYNQLGNGIVSLNNARKITDFPIPFPLAQMVTFMLIGQFAITVLVCATSVESSSWAGFLSFLVVFSFWSINYIAIELEMPFGDDTNDLPLHEMQTDLNKSLASLMNPAAQTCPTFSYAAYHDAMHTTDCHLDHYLAELAPDMFRSHSASSFSSCRSKSNWTRTSKSTENQVKISFRIKREQEHINQRQEKYKARKNSSGFERQKSVAINPLGPTPGESSDTIGKIDISQVVLTINEEGATDTQAVKRSFQTLDPGVRVASSEDASAHASSPSKVDPAPTRAPQSGSQQSILVTGGSGLDPDYSGVHVVGLSKRLENHFSQSAEELQAMRERTIHRSGPSCHSL